MPGGVRERAISRRPSSVSRSRRSPVLLVAAGLTLLSAAAFTAAGDLYEVSSISMEPTLHCGGAVGCSRLDPDRILVERVTYKLRAPRRQEVVLFRSPRGCAGEEAVKRIVAVAGDVVTYDSRGLFINGARVSESFLVKDGRTGRTVARTRVPGEAVFVLGDNRASSCDSRDYGPVARTAIRGRVFAKLPATRFPFGG